MSSPVVQGFPVADHETSLRNILSDSGYRFCHDKRYEWTRADHATWCGLGEAAGPRCPNIVESCRENRSGGGETHSGSPLGEDHARRETFSCQAPGLGAPALWLLWVFCLLAVAFLVHFLVRRSRLWLSRRQLSSLSPRRFPRLFHHRSPAILSTSYWIHDEC